MYHNARLKLTTLYSALFLSLFWLLSLGIYFSMSQALTNGYIAKISQHNIPSVLPQLDPTNATVALVAGSVALEQLKYILLLINGIAVLIVPISGWYLTGLTLNPIQRSNLQQRQFISDASHELRTPLSIVSGEIELALAKTHSHSEYKAVMTSTKEEVDRLSKLVEHLLFLARHDYTKTPPEFKPVDITDLLSSLISQFSPSISKKKIDLNFIPPATNLSVTGQISLLQMLFSNLLDNAIKYTPTSGRISVKISRSRQYASICIRDSGVGIDPKDLSQIFNRFYRGDLSRSSPKGFGLGLAIAKTIVDAHKGKISVTSSPHKGSAFTVLLPLSLFSTSPFFRKYLKRRRP